MEEDSWAGPSPEEQQTHQQGSLQAVHQEDHPRLHCSFCDIQADQKEMKKEIQEKMEEVDQKNLDREKQLLEELKEIGG